MIDADAEAAVADITAPAEGAAGFDRDAFLDGWRQDAGAVFSALRFEALPGGHADEAGGNAGGGEFLPGIMGLMEFGTGGDEDNLRLVVRCIGEDVGTLLHAARRGKDGAVEDRQILPAHQQDDRSVVAGHGDLPGFDCFAGIGRAEDDKIRHGAQAGELLNRLMRRTVFADCD